MKLKIYSSTTETACKLIQDINDTLMQQPCKVYNIAFSGGLTPALMYDLWANDFVDSTPWHRIYFWWVDERCVCPENSESNYGQMRSLLFNIAPIPKENVFRIKGENKPEYEAARYATLARKLIPLRNGLPRFDIVLLGVGDDGHVSSIFPGQEHLLSSPDIYVASYNPYTGQKRVAMTGKTILNADKVIFLVTGKGKASIIKKVFSAGDSYPASYIINHASNLELFMDQHAASKI